MATTALRTQQRARFSTIHSEGNLLPIDLLQRIEQLDAALPGLTARDYHVDGYKINEEINDAWLRALRDWQNFQAAIRAKHLPEHEQKFTLERWLLPLFRKGLGYGQLFPAHPIALESKEKSYPISYGWRHIPIHLVGYHQPIDEVRRTPGTTFRNSAYSLVQELLNNSNELLWGIVSNGRTLRLLRRNVSLTRQAYVEFDLEKMMQGESYADFALFWLLCHQSRFEGERPTDCWLEQWTKAAHEHGVRALDQLREGVERAINALGKGFLTATAPANYRLRTRLREGSLSPQDYYRQVLRLVYRLIVLFVAEDRDVLFSPQATAEAKERYLAYYSTRHLRQLAEQRIGTRHSDLFRGLWIVMEKLGSSEGYAPLGLPALNGFLFSAEAVRDLAGCEISNYALLDAIRSLSTTSDKGIRRTIDYKNIGAEELGSVYESLLELHPNLTIGASGVADFTLTQVSGNERKTSGSYYTPTSLIDCLLDSALDPVLLEASRQSDPERALLNLKVCDPACGSGHFLIAAAHRIAKKLAAVRTGDEEPAPEERRCALRDVVGHCIYGVDSNPMAVELCKVNLWMEAIDPGKPLSFLDAHILCGNSLLGTTPALMEQGIPESAFEPIEGDDKKVCSSWKKLNKQYREGNLTLFDTTGQPWEDQQVIENTMHEVDEIADSSVHEIHHKQASYQQLLDSPEYQESLLRANAWCAAFVWKKIKGGLEPITQDVFRRITDHPRQIAPAIRDEINRLYRQYQFFHWHLAFPTVFHVPTTDEQASENAQTGWSGGFDVVLGNPPWERIKIQEKEWFAARRPNIAEATNAAQRRNMIANLVHEDASLYTQFMEDQRQATGESHFVRDSKRYPLCGRGDVNTYALFAENMRHIQAPTGRVGCIVPSGIATDDTTKFFFQDLMHTQSLASLYSFENRYKIFPAVHSSYNFALLTLAGSAHPATQGAEFVFFAHNVADVQEKQRRFTLSDNDIKLLNPNTRTCSIFRTKRDMLLTKAIYEKVPILVNENNSSQNYWSVSFNRMFDMANDSHLFHTSEELQANGWQFQGNTFHRDGEIYLPLYEGKMIFQYDHRFSGYETNKDIENVRVKDEYNFVLPRYWVHQSYIQESVNGKNKALLTFRDIARSTDARTAIFSIIPITACGDTLHVVTINIRVPKKNIYFVSCANSFIFDYVTRQKIGGTHLKYFLTKQLPVLPPEHYTKECTWHRGESLGEWILPRALELTYTAWDLEAFASECGYDGPPFRWDEERRFLLRCELDAAYFHLYDIARDDVDYILETFPIVKRKDEKEYGEYRTKRVILEIYDGLQQAIATGVPYQTRLNPPPADPAMAHPAHR